MVLLGLTVGGISSQHWGGRGQLGVEFQDSQGYTKKKKKSQKPPTTKKQNKEVVLELKLFNKLRETVLDKAGWPGTLSFLS